MGKTRNLIVIPIVLAIIAATAWSVYHSANILPPVQKVELTTQPTEDFFERLYQERLKEEGNRTSHVKELLKEGKLSREPARYTAKPPQ